MDIEEFMDHLVTGLAHLNEINAQLTVFWPEQQHLVKLRLNEITAILVSAAQEAANMPIINSKPDYGSIGDYGLVGSGPSPAGVTIASISQNGATTAARTYKTFDDPRSMHFVPSPGEQQRIYARRVAIAFQDREELQRRQVAQSIASRERERILREEGNALFMNRSRLELERLENAAAAERQAIVARVQEAVTKTEAKEENRENPLEQHLTSLLQRVKEQNARTDAAAERQANIARAKEAVSKREALEHEKSVAQPEQTLPERIAQQPQPTAPSGPGSVESPSSGSSSQTPTWAQTPIEKDQDVAAPRPLTNAETLAKKHEEEERSHQLSIPTRSASGSWAGVAAEGVSKVVNKAINMHSITESPLTEPSRTLTTLGRFRSKTRTASGIPIDSPQQIKDLAAEVFPGPYEFRLEASADAQRSVCITNPPPTMTVQKISDAIHEGALVSIRPLEKPSTGKLYFLIIFQFAPCASSFLKVIEDERRQSRPRRFPYLVECARGPNQPRDATMHAMDEPTFARRRLTLAQKALFFTWKQQDIERFVYEHVPQNLVQFVHVYNGGNATICFTEVVAAAKIKAVLEDLAERKVDDGKWCDLNVSFSKDPCETELKFYSDFPLRGGRRSSAQVSA